MPTPNTASRRRRAAVSAAWRWAIAGIGIGIASFFLSGSSAEAREQTMHPYVEMGRFSVAGTGPEVSAAAFSADGSKLVTLASLLREANVFAVEDGRRQRSVADLTGGVSSIAVTASGEAVVPGQRRDSAGFALWNLETGAVRNVAGPAPRSADAVANSVFEFAVDAGGHRLAGIHRIRVGASIAFGLSVYALEPPALLADYAVAGTRPALSPDGSLVAVAAAGGRVLILDAARGTVIRDIAANRLPVHLLAFSADGRRLASGSVATGYGRIPETDRRGPLRDDDVLQLWDVDSGRRLAVVRDGIGGGVEAIAFSNDGRWLATTTADGTGRLWDAETLAPIAVLVRDLHPGRAFVVFSPDSRRLAIVRTATATAVIFEARGWL